MTSKMSSVIEKFNLTAIPFNGVEVSPTFVNFIFGKNGAGKSTIAKAISANEGVTWLSGKNPNDYKVYLFNRDFIESNFKSYGNLKGVFTVNKENIYVQEQIANKTTELDSVSVSIINYQNKKDELNKSLETHTKDCQQNFWKDSKKIRDIFDKTQDGKKGSIAKFFDELLRQTTAVDHDLKELEDLYEVAYDDSSRTYNLFRNIDDSTAVYNPDALSLLAKVVISSVDTEFAVFMRAINATDWVKSGHDRYAGIADHRCPFCQQILPNDFEQNIAKCFDQQYDEDIKLLKIFQKNYAVTMQSILSTLKANLEDAYPKMDLSGYKETLSQLEKNIVINNQLISSKLASPAQVIELKSTDSLFTKLSVLVSNINTAISTHNAIVSDQQNQQNECRKKVWEYIAFCFKNNVATYKKNKHSTEDAIKGIEKNITSLKNKHSILYGEIAELTGKSVNTRATIDGINAVLRDSGFEGFRIREKDGMSNTYEVMRDNGQLAENLSEGEKNFIAFLYFYHLVRGGYNEEDSAKGKIVVIDDPVSSMDSSVMFIVAALVREMVENCLNNTDYRRANPKENFIKQLFILTHNAFFHKEITYKMVEHYKCVTFFVVSKNQNKSIVKPCILKAKDSFDYDKNYNPVQNSYAALWSEFKEADSSISLMSVIRRILEYYFLQMCGNEADNLREVILKEHKDNFIKQLEGGSEDKSRLHLATSMLAYIGRTSEVNTGLDFFEDYKNCDHYREVFKLIFDAMNQGQHYAMMMADMPSVP